MRDAGTFAAVGHLSRIERLASDTQERPILYPAGPPPSIPSPLRRAQGASSMEAATENPQPPVMPHCNAASVARRTPDRTRGSR